MERLDMIIIGLGPAGVSAALTAKVRNKKVLVIARQEISDKVKKAGHILNYPGLPNVSGEQLAEKFMQQLASMNIEIVNEQVSAVYAMGDYFALQTDKNMYEASSVILASGVVSGKKLDGEEAFLGRGVSYCATCDAQFYKGAEIAVIGYGKGAEEEAEFLSEVAAKVKYIPMYKDFEEFANKAPANLEVLTEKPQKIEGQMKVERLETDKNSHNVEGVFILRDSVPAENLVPGLKMDESGSHVEVDLQMKTNIDGLFACGDITGLPYQYAKAAGQGNVAALSAVKYLLLKNNK